MSHIECKFTIVPDAITADVLIALLADMGFESFNEEYDCVYAYIEEDVYTTIDETSLQLLMSGIETVSCSKMEQRNWNSEWESNYNPVLIEDCCYIRAPFHEALIGMKYDIVIEPKMSFGTAHHETTELMIRAILTTACQDKRVLDMGCGTGVLAILAAQRGALSVTAIDFDQWSYENTVENFERNNITQGVVKLGDASILGEELYEIIFANINRNVLMQDMPNYVTVLEKGGLLMMSGFYEKDVEIITEKANALGLSCMYSNAKNSWAMLAFKYDK